jgi:hypothetical protein
VAPSDRCGLPQRESAGFFNCCKPKIVRRASVQMRDGAMVAVVMTVDFAWNDCRHGVIHGKFCFGFGFEGARS